MQSRENCVFQFPSKSLPKKLGFGLGPPQPSVCSSLSSAPLSRRRLDIREPLLAAGGDLLLCVCPRGVTPTASQPVINTLAVSQPASQSSECVVSIRLLLPLLCQGKSGDSRIFFSLLLCLSCFLISRRRRWWHCLSDVSLK